MDEIFILYLLLPFDICDVFSGSDTNCLYRSRKNGARIPNWRILLAANFDSFCINKNWKYSQRPYP